MNNMSVVEQIKHGQIKSVYLLYGQELFFARQIESAIIDTLLSPDEREMNLTIFSKDPPLPELVNRIETVPFLGAKNVIILRNTLLFRSNRKQSDEPETEMDEECLLAIMENMPAYSCVIFITGEKVDKRRRLFKIIEKNGVALELQPLKLKDAKSWIDLKLTENKKILDREAQEYLLAFLSLMPQISLELLNNEMDKLCLFTQAKTTITRSDLTTILSSVPEISIFTMVEAVSQKQVAKALALLREQFAAGEHPLKVVSLLARQVRLLWQIKELTAEDLNSRTIAENLGMHPFVVEKLTKQSKHFTIKQLKDALNELALADRLIKSSRGGEATIEPIIIQLCQ